MNWRPITTVFILLSAYISACAGAQELSQQDPSLNCFASIPSLPGLQILKNKVALGVASLATLDMLSNDKKPTKTEKVAISLWIDQSEKCASLGNDWRSLNYPAIVISLSEQYIAFTKSLAADLYARKISYGKFAKSRINAEEKYKVNLTEAVQKILAERKEQQDRIAEDNERKLQEHIRSQEEQNARNQAIEQRNAEIAAQNDQARRAAVRQFFSNQQQQQENIYQEQMKAIQRNTPVFRSPVNTNCYMVGNQMSCQSN